MFLSSSSTNNCDLRCLWCCKVLQVCETSTEIRNILMRIMSQIHIQDVKKRKAVSEDWPSCYAVFERRRSVLFVLTDEKSVYL